jgi:hypothetical protein
MVASLQFAQASVLQRWPRFDQLAIETDVLSFKVSLIPALLSIALEITLRDPPQCTTAAGPFTSAGH